MHFPELWEEDSLIFDDTAERELLLRQFQELIEEISSEEGYDIHYDADPFSLLRNEKGKVECSRELSSLFRSPTQHQPHSQWHTCTGTRETLNSELLAEGYQGNLNVQVNSCQHTRRYDVKAAVDPSDALLSLDHLSRGSPLTADESSNKPAFKMLPLCHSPKPDKMFGIVKLPDGNYYMAMPESSKRGFHDAACNGGMLPLKPSTRESVVTSRSAVTVTPSLETLSDVSEKFEYSCERTGRFAPKRLFSSDANKTNAKRTSRKRARTNPHLPNQPKPSPRLKDEIPQDIMEDLAVIRIHRRSSYADGDSLVEVQPSSLPGSPTMFAYRDPEGRLRVPLNMHCNKQALATYKSMAPSKATATKIVSVCSVLPRQPERNAGKVFEETPCGDFGLQQVVSDGEVTQSQPGPTINKEIVLDETICEDSSNKMVKCLSIVRTDVIHQRASEKAEAKICNEDSASTQTIIEEWEKLRQRI